MWATAVAWPHARATAVAAGVPASRPAAWQAASFRTGPTRRSFRAKADAPAKASRGRRSLGQTSSKSGSARSAQPRPRQ